MPQLLTPLALLLATTVALGPGDPVGISDAGESDPGLREVSIDGARWESLRALAEFEEPVEKPPGPWAADRQVQIERSSEGVRIRVTWTLEAIEAGWWTGPLVGPMAGMRVESVTWRGRELGVTSSAAGEEVAVEMAAKTRGELTLVVFVPGDQLPGGLEGDLEAWLMPAVRGEVRVAGPAPEGRVSELVAAGGQPRRMIKGSFWAGEAELSLNWVDAKLAGEGEQGPLAVAQSSVGLTFGDGEVRGQARVSWLVRRGQFASLTLDSAGLGRDLELVGPNVHAWARNGDRIDIELKEPVEGRVDVDLKWTQGLPDGAEAQLAAPRIVPQQVYRTESFMQIARDGELEVVPALSGWSAVARAELPEWASGTIEGTATATYRHEGADAGGSFELLRFVPLPGPPVLVDVAAYEIATTDEGRSLVHARYDVRNERASHLRIELPAGSRTLGVRVNGETVTPTLDAASANATTQAWRIPLVRSLESVKGILSFPVEVIFISESDNWAKKESRELQLPALDAPVAVSRVRVYLPPNYQNRVALGDFQRVSDFSEGDGITYGLGVGVSSAEVSRADELYRQALSGWMTNDFRQAQSSLDELGQLGASSANISGLQANLDLVEGRDGKDGEESGGQSAVVSRRIKDQAKTRAADDKIALVEKEREADELEAQGQYDEAEKKLAEAQDLGGRLAQLEQSESQEQIVYNRKLSSKSARVADKKKRKVSRESEATKQGKISVYDFEDDAVTGDLLVPEGAAQAGPIGGEVAAPEPEQKIAVSIDIDMEAANSIPIGSSTSRDFTAVVQTAPGSKPQRPDRAKPRDSRRQTRAPEQAVMSVMPVAPALDPNAALSGPVATASAVTVHVPTIGEAVLYQHMLLPEGKALTVHLEARRHKPWRHRHGHGSK